ncbi:MAG: phosphoglycerate dehydrogenase-like enzyme [Halioglobus sp.]|jgi:phosphoglycerate dehydrogenase-like enzyme
MIKVLFSKPFHKNDLAYLAERVHESISFLTPDTYDTEGVLARLNEADVLFGGMVNEQVLSAGSHLKLIQIPWNGVDSLDFELLSRFTVPICNSHSNSSVVAEHAAGMLMALAKKLPYHDSQLRQKKWNRVSANGNKVSPFSKKLKGARILYVGYGAIASECARMLSGFNMEVSIVNTSGTLPGTSDVPLKAIFAVEDLKEAVKDQDFIVVALPLTPGSKGLISTAEFDAMDSGTVLVNISRGTIIDEDALYEALSAGRLGGAAIDTWYNYPKPGDPDVPPSTEYDFAQFSHLLLSPHRAGYAEGGLPHLDDGITNLNNLVVGEPFINLLDTEKRY